jgi:hypothetical protein
VLFIHGTLQFTIINLNYFCKEQSPEVCGVELHLSAISFCILSIYRSPVGNFLYFLKAFLISLYSNTIEFMVCGDPNIYDLNDNGKIR